MIDRVAEDLGRTLVEVPVGFKWFVPGLLDGSVGFGGEESAGRVLPAPGRHGLDDGQGRDPPGPARRRDHRDDRQDAEPALRRARRPSTASPPTRGSTPRPTASRRRSWRRSPPTTSRRQTLAGEPITAKLTEAPGNGAAIGGLKVVTETAWFAARPSGTEDVYKIYAESFRGPDHLAQVQAEARDVVSAALDG